MPTVTALNEVRWHPPRPSASGRCWATTTHPSSARRARQLGARGRAVWHVNSTARGGGVAEMLQSLLAYARGAGVDVRWLTIGGAIRTSFGSPSESTTTSTAPPATAASSGRRAGRLRACAREERRRARGTVSEGDVVYLHDPQTIGMVDALAGTGVRVVWRCHIGLDNPNDLARQAWSFLRPYVIEADACVFSRRAFVWDGPRGGPASGSWRLRSMPSRPRNQDLAPAVVDAILARIGIAPRGYGPGRRCSLAATAARAWSNARPSSIRSRPFRPTRRSLPSVAVVAVGSAQGSSGRPARLSPRRRAPDRSPAARRPVGRRGRRRSRGRGVLAEARDQLAALPPSVARAGAPRCLPMDDVDENAAMVNALQRRADIVLQKSFAEGFGLTGGEAMWKARPVIASRIGGIQTRSPTGRTGVLIDEPTDLEATGRANRRTARRPEGARAIGAAGPPRASARPSSARGPGPVHGLLEQMLDGHPPEPAPDQR